MRLYIDQNYVDGNLEDCGIRDQMSLSSELCTMSFIYSQSYYLIITSQ